MKKISKYLLIILISLTSISTVDAQKYFTRDGYISFFSSTSVEDIKAINSKVSCVLDSESGAIELAALMKAFEFKKALMEEHFNENYVESATYPKAAFKGKIEKIEDIDFTANGVHPVRVNGEMSIHGETNTVSAEGSLEVKDGNVIIKSEFYIVPEDYAIEIPGVVRDKIAKQLLITVEVTLAPYTR